MSEQIIYECVRCGLRAPLEKWMRTGETGDFKCPVCSYRLGKKVRPPISKRVKAV